jgi:serine/threonine protein kinase
MRCPVCEPPVPDGSRFCNWCGRPLTDPALATQLATDLDLTVASVVPVVPPTGTAVFTSAAARTSFHPAAGDVRFAPGSLLADRYRIVRELGRGGMGVVYQAEDLRLAHPVALKFLPPSLASDSRRLAQFHNEVSVARQVSHPNVCRVYDIAEVDGHLFLSMEYVEGEDLSAVLHRRGPIPEKEAIELIREICAGLAAVHARGVLHRDLKPANIMLNSAGHALLMDFGIAGGNAPHGANHTQEGTPAYMAPEQLAAAGAADASIATDIYALGLVIHEILSGERLLSGTTIHELRERHGALRTVVPATLGSAVSPQLQQALLRCLAREPSARPASAQAVASMLQTVLLDARSRGRRVLQVLSQSMVVPLTLLGLSVFVRPTLVSTSIGLLILAVVALIVFLEVRFPLGWTVAYKGHRIRFHNHAVFGERLYIDGALMDRGRLGQNITLRGTIEAGAGAGERITAQVSCRFTQVTCRIVAESFAPSTITASETV